jgi:predicted RNA-binding protein with PUA-like domain
MAKRHWLAKSEPFKYPWSRLVEEGRTAWDGVRNFEARNNLRAMAKGDLVLFYHSNEGKEVVGLAEVARTAYQDPTTEEDWSVVEVVPRAAFPKPVTLAAIKAEPRLAQMALLRRSRLSVVPVEVEEFELLLHMGACKLPASRRR